MNNALLKEDIADEIRMGSEYATAGAYLARRPKVRTMQDAPDATPSARRGSNDSDFGSFGQ